MTAELEARRSTAPTAFVPAPTGLRAAVLGRGARILLRRAARRSGVHLIRPGDPVPAGPVLTLIDPDAVARRIGTARLIGFGESYVAGEWDSPDLAAALTALAERMPALVPRWVQLLRPLAAVARPHTEVGTEDHVQDNISHHYDLSNELFARFLDETLTYSSALFCTTELPDSEPGVTRAPQVAEPAYAVLADAQRAKIDRLLDAAGVGPGSRVLEVGTGWGELCLRAARRGATVRSVTLSVEQRDLARRRMAEAGLSDVVQIELRDYRDVRGRYDAVVSVEMIEAVGAAHWDEYFAVLARVLAPGGRIALQAITMPHDRMLATLHTYTWIQKYIFPGGMLPSTEAIAAAAGRAGLTVRARHRFGAHYGQTLRLWRERFRTEPQTLPPPADSPEFRRLWEFYLAYSEAGFRSGYLDVQQIVLTEEAAR
ncbi:Cyclopropane-fatty-acyl-phospholipid synthase OS=Tsukamurella paurometabola (strain ATCC 8368 / DSM / CCUG 35730 / CIP 100753 / JCM 10117 / KCTC 9821 /NBRC 16120 / NCIMB 702349 / NCTC 13040) OX=521096 GN=Tpau_3585 PE=3 SV=1 [Tsukamurella paurometabola]|uniref:Cyclopropane-fatty-acyl-phospholipid synthase n=1 Tax=Tsukamurella paurometabola (strain ATCC 8368 / DSM 20162 / CCUG 35730 / CIP 100753 / JCM 10117 / KCTC 9821 / NBRC 16120 / NCIMB 702349 / NCTC 13040) TaxID=521096 RepID=D5UXS6_TSUPD|nr:cyclopropane-fatty-acyl-phospholipid synthase family protein [Tsukamurella paurometabola]ADG80163.1 Cyclopropane-fatty-acyl-phospholipid synthase [Tsukamurella paurometabola DSM 20162]SUP38665.1 Cyclopropane-fatty-acyl-phospholipid synthase [Tsukamurella paurometabola]